MVGEGRSDNTELTTVTAAVAIDAANEKKKTEIEMNI
jgi:hypothetical protein